MMAEATVPILVHDIERRGGLKERHVEWLQQQVDVIGSEGDALTCSIKGETAKKSAVLFRCLAYMAFFPGGVEFMGKRYMSTERKIEWDSIDHPDKEA
jgi:hypothetical protein